LKLGRVIPAAILLWALTAQTQISADEFVQKMNEHRSRVAASGMLLRDSFPDIFKDVPPELVAEYLALHDRPKIESLAELRQRGYEGSKSLAARLARFYNTNINQLRPDIANILRADIADLNRLEDLEKRDFFSRKNISPEQIHLLQWLEEIADYTDVGLHRREELSLKAEPYDGMRFLLKHGDKPGARLSRWLEDHLIAMNRENPSCKSLFGL
jgi:hypothetical protein